jgi:hypothetical protein
MLVDWNNSPQVDMLAHLDILSWFQANQALLLLLHANCLAEKQIPILVFGLTRVRLKPTI